MGRNIFIGMGIAGLGWGLLLLTFVWAVVGLYQRGHGSIKAMLILVGVPLLGLIAAIPVPVLLHRRGRTVAARAVAIWALGALPLAFILTMMLAAI
jgi:hypothetical protein